MTTWLSDLASWATFHLVPRAREELTVHKGTVVTVAILAQGTILGANATRRPFLSLGFESGCGRFFYIMFCLLSVSDAMHQWTDYVTTKMKFDSLARRRNGSAECHEVWDNVGSSNVAIVR